MPWQTFAPNCASQVTAPPPAPSVAAPSCVPPSDVAASPPSVAELCAAGVLEQPAIAIKPASGTNLWNRDMKALLKAPSATSYAETHRQIPPVSRVRESVLGIVAVG
jgi:hypothetical protein